MRLRFVILMTDTWRVKRCKIIIIIIIISTYKCHLGCSFRHAMGTMFAATELKRCASNAVLDSATVQRSTRGKLWDRSTSTVGKQHGCGEHLISAMLTPSKQFPVFTYSAPGRTSSGQSAAEFQCHVTCRRSPVPVQCWLRDAWPVTNVRLTTVIHTRC